MKKQFMVLLATLLTGSLLFAASDTGTITLKTTVATIESVAFDKDDDTKTDVVFDSLATNATSFDLGSLFLNSNAPGGFLLTFTNNSSSKLANSSGDSALAYTLKITNGSGDTAGDNPLSSASQADITFGTAYDFTSNVGGDVTIDKEFELDLVLPSTVEASNLQAGVHSSIITIEIANQ